MKKTDRIIKYFVMDVDGTLTDGKIYMSACGEAMKAFNIKDGYGIHDILIPSGIIPIIITGRSSDIVNNRCRELGITEVYQGISDKLNILKNVTDKELKYVAYIGDDINDLTCMNAIKTAGGIVGCPADAFNKIKEISDFVSKYNGGDGAVRDFIEWICN
ncbi:MAG: 3-deoxy-D-manno-octulosonate 8-phosphate phosphatase [Lachnospiraceae bacterium]|nr:3-deoxy-D-manno-octulosonate 8-phosphate phosphatase [Lachnospiraceae bacterium]